ncbi:MAG: Asp/Glu/hydantoin racemase [Xanthobacteraceae bacterium]
MPDSRNTVAGPAVRLGMLTPSSNTVLEPITVAMTAGLPGVSSHFSRFRVTRIGLDEDELRQFDIDPILAAAGLLADARVNVIGWSGTSGSWLGEDHDRALCRRIEAETGTAATTSVLAINEVLSRTGRRRVGLVTPYTQDVQARIVATYAGLGIDCIAERHLGDPGNFSFAQWPEQEVARLIREVAAARPEAILVMCTNFRGAPVVEALERELGIPIYDSIAAVVWKSLAMAGTPPAAVRGWGRLFAELS